MIDLWNSIHNNCIMTDASNSNWESQPEVLPAPEPSFCTVSLPNGAFVPLHAIHYQPPPPHDNTCTFHLNLRSSPSCTYCGYVDKIFGMSSASTIPAAASVPQASSSRTGSSSSPIADRSPTFGSVPLSPPSPGGYRTRRKAAAFPKNRAVPVNMMSVFQSRTDGRSYPSNRARDRIVGPSSSTGASESSLVHRASPSSRRDPRCTCSLPPDLEWARHWRRSCPRNPDRRYPCPKGCGREFTRKDNAKRHVKLRECPLLLDSNRTPEQPSDAYSSFSGSLVSPSFGFFSTSP